MRSVSWLLLWLVPGLLVLLPGCGKQSVADSPEAAAKALAVAEGFKALDHAQPKLATIKLWLGDQELVTEVARRPYELMTGMMFRTNMAENEGMIFLLAAPQRASFYMRNTKVPLDCAYLDLDGNILEIHALQPLNETPVESTATNVQFVLETPQGWFQRHNVRTGAVVRTQYGSLPSLDWSTLRPRAVR